MTTTARAAALVLTVAVTLPAGCGVLGDDAGGGPADAGGDAARADPEEVVRAFLDARIADDCDAYRAFYTPELAEDSSCYEVPLTRSGEFPRVDGAETEGDTSSVETTDLFECTGPGAGSPVEETVTYALVLTDGEWLIDGVDLEGVTDDDCIGANGG